MTLPDMEGSEVAKKIKSIDAVKTVPIIMMSGRGLCLGDVDPALFVGILNKPFSLAGPGEKSRKIRCQIISSIVY